VEKVVARKKFPYRTKGDLLRHALHRHLNWLTTQGAVSSISGQVDVILELIRDEELNSDFLMVFDKLSERISGHLSSGSKGEAIRLIRVVQNHIKSMPEGYWRRRYEEQLEVKFGHLVAGQERASLSSIDEE
jgi:hypothetical protein